MELEYSTLDDIIAELNTREVSPPFFCVYQTESGQWSYAVQKGLTVMQTLQHLNEWQGKLLSYTASQL